MAIACSSRPIPSAAQHDIEARAGSCRIGVASAADAQRAFDTAVRRRLPGSVCGTGPTRDQ